MKLGWKFNRPDFLGCMEKKLPWYFLFKRNRSISFKTLCLARLYVKYLTVFDIGHKMADKRNRFPCLFASLRLSNKNVSRHYRKQQAPVCSAVENIFYWQSHVEYEILNENCNGGIQCQDAQKSLSNESKTLPWKHWSRCSSFPRIKISGDTMLIALNSFQLCYKWSNKEN